MNKFRSARCAYRRPRAVHKSSLRSGPIYARATLSVYFNMIFQSGTHDMCHTDIQRHEQQTIPAAPSPQHPTACDHCASTAALCHATGDTRCLVWRKEGEVEVEGGDE